MMHILSFTIAIIWLTVVGLPTTIGYPSRYLRCPTLDYYPCDCLQSVNITTGEPTNYIKIVCDKVPIADVKVLFSNLPIRQLIEFEMHISPFETSAIPADLLSSSSAEILSIICDTSNNLVMDDNAFRSSKNSSKFVTMGCDFTKQPNFSFLSDFHALFEVIIVKTKNIKNFHGLPPGINTLEISSCQFKNLIDGHYIELPNLNHLILPNNQFGDDAAAKILKTLASSSKESLFMLEMNGNNLTRIPEMISSFTELTLIRLNRNAITSIDTQLFGTSGSIPNIDLSGNAIATIRPNAFRALTHVHDYFYLGLNDNKLTRFDSHIFQSMLESISKTQNSRLSLHQNPIECDCHLAWLIVHKRNFLPFISGGRCSNSTSFKYLKPEGFRNCPAFTCPTDINGNFPNPLSFSSYYTCKDGKSAPVTCPVGKVFNRSTLQCDLSKKRTNMPAQSFWGHFPI